MKKFYISIFLISVFILIILICKYIQISIFAETFKNPFKSLFKKDEIENPTLEQEYKIKNKNLDETQSLNIWELDWVKKHRDNKYLKNLWNRLSIVFPLLVVQKFI